MHVVAVDKSTTKVNFRKVAANGATNGEFEVMIPKSSMIEVNNWLSNSIYRYLFRKRIAFPVVENYVFNAWGKFGIQKIMMMRRVFTFSCLHQKREWKTYFRMGFPSLVPT